MKTIKIIDATVDIKIMSELFGGSLDLVIMKHLVDKFVGQCHKSCLFLKINKIIRRGDVIINPMSSSGEGYVNVQFEADVIVIVPGEGLIAKILNIDTATNYIQATKNDQIAINMHRSKLLRTVQDGQLIPVRSLNSRYQIAKNMISVEGQMYLIPQSEAYIFKIDKLTNTDKEDLLPYVDEIQSMEKDMKKLDTKLVKFFNELLYPFTKTKNITGKLEDMKKLSAYGYVVRHERTDKLTPNIYILKKEPPSFQEQPAKLVYQAFFNDYKLHMMFIRELVETFSDSKLKKSHDNVWAIYKAYKKS